MKKLLLFLIGLLFFSGLLMNYNGDSSVRAESTWTFVDGGLTTGLNYDVIQNATNPVLGWQGMSLYAAWEENMGANTGVISWRGVNPPSVTSAATQPTLITFNGSRYGAYVQASPARIRVWGSNTSYTIDGLGLSLFYRRHLCGPPNTGRIQWEVICGLGGNRVRI